MDINWGTLAGVFAISLGVTAVVVVMFSLGLAAWARAGHGEPTSHPPGVRHQKAATAIALLCFASCLAVAAYGIGLIVTG
ncbi:hypothetical protein CP981_29180 [Streptomyces platensis]|uniref:Uncharacterized protein n=1 Tax=Streptomyces platensis TaxID=58346 RepID=A0AAE6NNR3_STRPT|nr:hypothetical protein [Streptomyces platensis]OSY43728.1 hypothetical protein BG653_04417 [Streptomyces platensis]QEV55175.1 hypothetical protein CP981_29180 [Streptomyces platensis]